jgi:hypothetical protein
MPEGKQSSRKLPPHSAKADLQGITAIKLEMLPDDRLPNNGPGVAPDGNFVLGEFVVTTDAADAKRKRGSGVAQTLKNPKADFEQKTSPSPKPSKKAIATAAGPSAPKAASATRPRSV